ncbi:hypothetical protein [Primorskyibacter sp. 2E233]|uniref:hypothetical protein n=1 Tax=Primorskyibacter sp. 2E233 TaxID=3413431 RepID=UPI003BEF65B0
MDRRQFIITASVASGALPGVLPAGSCEGQQFAKATLSPEYLGQVANAVRVNFGPGFRVISAKPQTRKLAAVIENRGNRFLVVSTDLKRWEIVTSTDL